MWVCIWQTKRQWLSEQPHSNKEQERKKERVEQVKGLSSSVIDQSRQTGSVGAKGWEVETRGERKGCYRPINKSKCHFLDQSAYRAKVSTSIFQENLFLLLLQHFSLPQCSQLRFLSSFTFSQTNSATTFLTFSHISTKSVSSLKRLEQRASCSLSSCQRK